MKKQRICGIILFLLGIVFCFSTLRIIDSEISMSICIPVCTLGIALFVYSFDWSKHNTSNPNKMFKASREQLIKEEMSVGFNQYLDCILKIYFNSDYTKRIIIYKENNEVLVTAENLYFLTEEESRFSDYYAVWMASNLGISFYDNLDTALKENQHILKDYNEVETDFFYLNNNKRHIVEIKWNNNRKSGIPYSTKYRPQIRVDGSNYRDVTLMNIRELDSYKTKGIMYFIISKNINAEDTLSIGTKFDVCEGPTVVGVGNVTGYIE